ncbi:exodeoxyribonuclease V subunit gamma [Alkalimarinus alittae]|uniref:RecBCD enzyme subunit RecC n=1 Tax=Alkalimarinus alittae TaxID=2961619 RepID=A0ABY6MXR0_9ALTE|nr:exodeoxyribonuclease V subunit gamma [Alkalimarinus alittae]UZE94619.1 exodeoxyribonuclease V subunit gamma [Alkalimarinus alittae]
MLNFYPGNRMEDLVTLLSRLLEIPSDDPLSEDTVVVQNQGMHHWLSLELASRRGVVMNTRYPLPGNFFWGLINTILADESLPDKTPYSREILIWAIYESLGADSFFNDPSCAEANHYWFDAANQKEDALKRFQLSRELADLFEQYLIYRPEWISLWASDGGRAASEANASDLIAHHWQGTLWTHLHKRLGDPPLSLIEKAIAKLATSSQPLPKRIFIFGINALPPVWMDFIKVIASYTDVHFFMLNPSDEYWGDIRSEKTLIRERAKWLEKGQPLSAIFDEIGNPLLANLGQQGQECLKLLCDRTDTEIPLFYSAGRDTLLQRVQDDILTLSDKRTKQPDSASEQPEEGDSSIVVASAHSALREIQVLHDWLLMQFKHDSTLTPKDVLVMSPQVENYAPYIDSVFKRGRSFDTEVDPQLPCSIADRTLNDLEPVIQAFIELLTLPDSRFQVSQILGYLRIPAVQSRFGLEPSDVELYTHWLSVAAIHWGLDREHKAGFTGVKRSNERFTWKQGLDRLIIGFAQADSEQIYEGADGIQMLTLPWVEGSYADKLGRLLGLIENLQYYAKQLTQERTPADWQHFLIRLIESTFEEAGEDASGYQIIIKAINTLVENAVAANFSGKLSLPVVSAYLNNCFSQPQQGQSFMTGQITFCSMIPMRSVPFKIIAILGLNDGDFPRQRQPMGFDLLAESPPRLGDRSRRGDDRYLFLEALISARDKLYLSYQGSDIKNNQERQPSLLVKELIDYLDAGYGWNSNKQIQRHPLQPFSHKNYQSPFFGFNGSWLSLGDGREPRDNLTPIPYKSQPAEAANAKQVEGDVSTDDDALIAIDVERLVSFFDNPSRAMGIERLKLYLNAAVAEMPEDAEPFTTNFLDRYIIQSELIDSSIDGDDLDQRIHHELLRGNLPDTPRTALELAEWKAQAEVFSAALKNMIDQPMERISISVVIGDYQISGTCWLSGSTVIFWRPADPKGKDLVRMRLFHLLVSLASQRGDFPLIESTKGLYRDQKNEGYQILEFGLIEDPQAELEKWLAEREEGLISPRLINAELARKIFEKRRAGKVFAASDFDGIWCDSFNQRGLSYDAYIQWFWQQKPEWPGIWEQAIVDLYSPLFDSLQEHQP